jgi:hypothetical protein
VFGDAEETEFRHAKIITAIQDVTNKQKCIELLIQTCLPKISSHNYADLEFLFSQVVSLDSSFTEARKGLSILTVLKDYYESKNLEAMNRIQFHQLVADPWKTLSKEITTDSILFLLPLANIMDLSADQFYITVINQMVELLTKSNGNGSVKFADFKKWINKLQTFELAVQTSVFVAGRFPCGEDRIAAYKVAYLLAEKWSLQKSMVYIDNLGQTTYLQGEYYSFEDRRFA